MTRYHNKKFLSPAAKPESRSSRVYRVEASEMPGSPDIFNARQLVDTAKRNHAKISDYDKSDLIARKINESSNENGGYIEVVVVEP